MMGSFSITTIIMLFVALIIAMTVHEFMHAWVGFKLGDTTAHDEGRISLNPLNHIDPFMTVLLPLITIILFQMPILAAKPVPFTPWRVRYHEKGVALLAFAGPLSNLALAAVTSVIAHGLTPGSLAYTFALIFIQLNVGLFVFNIIPIPPLDGSRVLYAFLPESAQRVMDQIEPYGFFIIFGIALMGGFAGILGAPTELLLNIFGVR